MDWYIARNGFPTGPFTYEQLLAAAGVGDLNPADMLWHRGLDKWTAASEIPGLLAPPAIESNAHAQMGIDLNQDTNGLAKSNQPPKPQASANGAVAPRKESMNIVSRHWRGDYSLAVSYWGIGFLVTVLSGVVLAVFSSDNSFTQWQRQLGRFGSGFMLVLPWMFFAILTVWQLTGVWRSADSHTSRGGKAFWANAAKTMVVFAAIKVGANFVTLGVPIVSEGIKLIVGIDEVPKYQLRILNNGTELELSGGMPYGTTDGVRKILNAAPTIRLIQLNSVGGRAQEGLSLAKLIKDRNLTTYTPITCVSACAIAFVAGKERYLGEHGKLGFHSIAIGGVDEEEAPNINDDIRAYFRDHDIPNDFANKAVSTPSRQMWYPTTDELLKAHVITAVVDSDHYGLSGIAQWSDAHELESGILEIPAFTALKQYDPTDYKPIRDIIINGIQQGRPVSDIQQDTRAVFFNKILPKVLASAPDQPLIRYWRSQIAEMEYLGNTNPADCVALAYPQFATHAPNLMKLVPTKLYQEDLSALAAVIKAASVSPQEVIRSKEPNKDLIKVIKTLNQKYPKALPVIAKPERYKDQPALLCASIVVFFDQVLDLPTSAKSAGVLRSVMASAH